MGDFMTELLLHSFFLFGELVSFIQECKFLQAPTRRFGEEEVYENDLEKQEYTVANVVFPTSLCNSNGIHELVEETSHTTEPLENGDTLGSDMEGEQLNQECVRQGIVGHVITRTVQKYECDDSPR